MHKYKHRKIPLNGRAGLSNHDKQHNLNRIYGGAQWDDNMKPMATYMHRISDRKIRS